jgi:hypothetical protein
MAELGMKTVQTANSVRCYQYALKTLSHLEAITLNTKVSHNYVENYDTKASCVHRILGAKNSTGRVTPKRHMARIYYHLIHGYEVSPCDAVHAKKLCLVRLGSTP